MDEVIEWNKIVCKLLKNNFISIWFCYDLL